MAIFYQGEKNPSDNVVEADTFQIVRYGTSAKQVIAELRAHFEGNVSDERLRTAIAKLNR